MGRISRSQNVRHAILTKTFPVAHSCLRLGEFTFARNAFMRFVRALDAILTLAISVRKNLDHFKNTTWRIPTNCRPDGNNVSDVKFVGRHRLLAFPGDNRWRHLNPVDATLTGPHPVSAPTRRVENDGPGLATRRHRRASDDRRNGYHPNCGISTRPPRRPQVDVKYCATSGRD